MRLFVAIAVSFSIMCAANNLVAQAPVRYALIVGNNYGRTPADIKLPDLARAESEAFRVRDRLVSLGNFNKNQVVVLTGKSRSEIIRAAKKLSRQHKQENEKLGSVPTLFLFYYTGHGLEGQLLTADEPLTAQDLGEIFEDFGATFTMGIFDACFSGSLDLERLKGKGIKVLNGFNAFEQLPREVLNSAGTMWFTSSSPNQISYEDDEVGGVFTHFFLEAMEKAKSDGFGVTVESIWEYASRRTKEYTSKAGRPQTPQKIIRNLTSSGPLFFSFPQKRNAALVFDLKVEGCFLLRYESGQLTELIKKRGGKSLTVPVFASDLILERIDGPRKDRQHFSVRSGSVVTVRNRQDWRPKESFGRTDEELRAKGVSLRENALTENKSTLTGLLEVGYDASFATEYTPVSMNAASLGLRLIYGPLFLRLGGAWGRQTNTYEAWGYRLNRGEIGIDVGPAITKGRFSFGLFVLGRLFANSITYDDGTQRDQKAMGMGGGASFIVKLFDDPFVLCAFAQGSIRAEFAQPIAPAGLDKEWRPVWGAGGGLAVKVF